MNDLSALPLWAAILIALLLVAGSTLTLLGAVGLLRLRSFYERLHAPTLGTSGGVLLVLIASMLCFTVLQQRLVVHEVLIFIFITLTTPVTLMLLGRAALYRDRTEGNDGVPAFEPEEIVSEADQ
ncbi:putative K(+)/H(+) antiporter subunit G [Agaricicola taiwanensis]|uniref:Putative K(+)/H(+) antiporter subunit G n=1 Tax=Agaricicola taiwanensis TaxID=591372 RepID=A0A8J2YNA7_9RHOB|nr:monovalent cation/H(+) antiporter subunit G [Agaricicola taiwanensis]GGE54228.1 putative K(+)/H(+) antiporter subunit G [Agaricicola taiwanensis]